MVLFWSRRSFWSWCGHSVVISGILIWSKLVRKSFPGHVDKNFWWVRDFFISWRSWRYESYRMTAISYGVKSSDFKNLQKWHFLEGHFRFLYKYTDLLIYLGNRRPNYGISLVSSVPVRPSITPSLSLLIWFLETDFRFLHFRFFGI